MATQSERERVNEGEEEGERELSRLVFLAAAELLAMHEICIFYTPNSTHIGFKLQFGRLWQKYFGIAYFLGQRQHGGSLYECVCVRVCV